MNFKMDYATWIYDLNLDRTYIARITGDNCYKYPNSIVNTCDALYSVQ